MYAIDEEQIRQHGRHLAMLAMLGQAIAVLSLIRTPMVLYRIQEPTAGGKPPLPFLLDTYVRGPFAPYNWHGLLFVAAFFVLLECLRRLGRSMRTDMPLGGETARWIGILRWACVPLALLACVQVEMEPSMQDGVLLGFHATYDFSVTALYFALLAVAGLSLVHRIVRHAVVLHAENESFV
ncbi:MAG: hypothetical protein J7507_01020 [Pseudoxanthomonas sp.]|nr:hypothetical protein [Pseudoxanthomonas sp.]